METTEKHGAPETPGTFNVEAAREQLSGKAGKRYWRTLGELADTPEFQKWVEDEFPNRSTLMQINRRDLLKFMGAGMALAGLTGCRGVFLPEDKVVPYVRQPEELVPGKSLFYASAVTLGGYATGVLVEQMEGRPIKMEGNPEHPASLGALDAISQAQVLGFYDPDRSGSVLNRTNLGYDADLSTWELFEASIAKLMAEKRASGGTGVRILTGSVTSPTFTGLMARFLKRYPNARWHAYEPVGRSNSLEGARQALGGAFDAVYDFSRANVVVSLDSDFFSPVANPGSLRYARDFMERRRIKGYEGTMNRLYAIQSSPTLVGATADHTWTVRGSEVYAHALALAAALGVAGIAAAPGDLKIDAAHLAAIAKDLAANAGSSLVVPGEHQPPAVHAVAHAINAHLRNAGSTVNYIPSVDVTANPPGSAVQVGDLATLVQDLNGNAVDTLIVIEGNPVYDAPADLAFGEAMLKARTKIRLGAYDDETSLWSEWHLPIAHELESWGDARAFDGTLSVIQPLMAPLFEGRSPIEFVSLLLGEPRGGYDLVRAQWQASGFVGAKAAGNAFEEAWRTAVHDGLVKNSAAKPAAPSLTLNGSALAAPQPVQGIEINFRPDPCVYDGRYTNNGWLMELPRPLTKLTWDNAAIVSPAMARQLNVDGLSGEDAIVTLSLHGKQVKAPLFVQPGHPNDSVTVHLGFGRTRGGVVASVGDHGAQIETVVPSENDKMGGGGFNAYALRSQAAPYIEGGLAIEVFSKNNYGLATTQGHQPLDGDHVAQFEGDRREVIVEHDLETYRAEGAKIAEEREHEYKHLDEQNLFPDTIFEYEGPQWGMTIDLNTCIGCNACVTACQAENNIPVVGKEQVARHREMHWLRIDRYYSGDEENPQVAWQPVMCVHCEKAPCEPVCPVAATVHSHEGLNQMTYNRCVGTRYCSNNCPYKVRRFNYLNYTDNQKQYDVHLDEKPRIPLLRMLNNPNVTVRGRGIMEKCTYCVQRINEVRIEAKKQNREPKDGEILTACQQACPTKTIVFGNVADKESEVYKLRHDPRAYLLLEELLTRPRTSHLAKLRNPNPEIPRPQAAGHATEGQ
jgi:molybdopterin-containing oxidoreductase family iron-sulfur binding subunit